MASGVDADEEVGTETTDEVGRRARKVEYPLHVEYCGVCTLPPEVI